jgi:hypothetical protein
MAKTRLTVFLCAGKDCSRQWKAICAAPGKWLKHQVKEAGLPYKLNVVETCCQDRCEEAACLCCVAGPRALVETCIRSRHDADRILSGLRACAESVEAARGTYG